MSANPHEGALATTVNPRSTRGRRVSRFRRASATMERSAPMVTRAIPQQRCSGTTTSMPFASSTLMVPSASPCGSWNRAKQPAK